MESYVTEVELLARTRHATQTDKAGRPYSEHLEAVADNVRINGGSDAQVAAAWLHDAVEDGALSEIELDALAVPEETKRIVLAVTKHPRESDEDYAQRILNEPGARLVKAADIAHNSDPSRLAKLDDPVKKRLALKYTNMRLLLGIEVPE
ncbi:MAG: HD domain-containing protein [Pseudonocardiales bacterium]|nr:HD domain-containing protein [Pseudonocardiales bacterium]